MRLLNRIYKLSFRCIVSAAPLTSSFSSVLPIPFFGQFYRNSDSSNFWLKLFYYHFSGFGPPTLLLTKGYALQQLPRMFLGYSSLLVTIVSTDSYVLNTNNYKSINKQLKNSCVLIQGYGIRTAGELHYESFPFNETRPEFAQHRGVLRMQKHLNFTNTCGYVTFLKTGVRDIGCDDDVADVKLQRPQRRRSSAKGQQQRQPQKTSIPSPTSADYSDRKGSVSELMSPNDDVDISTFQQKFALPSEEKKSSSPSGGSPANEYRSEDCNELLQSELDNLAANSQEKRSELISQASIEIPIDGQVVAESVNEGEEWTVLDVQFGVPLFDFDCNTTICQSLVKTLMAEEK